MKDALAVHRWLLTHQIHHEIVRLPRPIRCADELPDALGLPPIRCVAVHIFEISGRDGLTAVITTSGRPPDPTVVGQLFGTRPAEPAAPMRVNMETGYCGGLAGPLLLPETVSVLVDHRLVDRLDDDDVVYAATGENRTAVGLRAFDLFSCTSAKPVDLRSGKQRIPAQRRVDQPVRLGSASDSVRPRRG